MRSDHSEKSPGPRPSLLSAGQTEKSGRVAPPLFLLLTAAHRGGMFCLLLRLCLLHTGLLLPVLPVDQMPGDGFIDQEGHHGVDPRLNEVEGDNHRDQQGLHKFPVGRQPPRCPQGPG